MSSGDAFGAMKALTPASKASARRVRSPLDENAITFRRGYFASAPLEDVRLLALGLDACDQQVGLVLVQEARCLDRVGRPSGNRQTLAQDWLENLEDERVPVEQHSHRQPPHRSRISSCIAQGRVCDQSNKVEVSFENSRIRLYTASSTLARCCKHPNR